MFSWLSKSVMDTSANYVSIVCCYNLHIEGWAQDYGNSNIFLKPLFRGNLDPFVNNANLGAIAHTSNGTLIFIVYRKKCCNLHNTFMVRRLGLGKNNHLTYASLALNPRYLTAKAWHMKIKIDTWANFGVA